MSPYKDKSKPELRNLKITLLKERRDMFQEAKALAERELGKMSDGGFLEILVVNYMLSKNYEKEQKRNKI